MKKDRSSIRRIVLQSFRCGLFIVGGLLSETMTAQNRAVVFDVISLRRKAWLFHRKSRIGMKSA